MLPAMVLCAGLGTRLRPLTDLLPKPLLPVGDRPAVQHILEPLRRSGFEPLVMNTHHRAEAFQGVLPPDIRVVHEPVILGTAGGVANARALLGDGDILVWNGDVIAEPCLEALVACHRNSNAQGATLLAAPRNPGEGTLGLDEAGCVVRLRGKVFGQEKSGADFLGIQVLSPKLRERLPAQGCLVGDVYLPLLAQGLRLQVHLHQGAWDDIGTPRALLEANRRWLQGKQVTCWSAEPIPSSVTLSQSIVCAGATVVGRGEVRECLVLAGASLEAPAQRTIALPTGQLLRVD